MTGSDGVWDGLIGVTIPEFSSLSVASEVVGAEADDVFVNWVGIGTLAELWLGYVVTLPLTVDVVSPDVLGDPAEILVVGRIDEVDSPREVLVVFIGHRVDTDGAELGFVSIELLAVIGSVVGDSGFDSDPVAESDGISLETSVVGRVCDGPLGEAIGDVVKLSVVEGNVKGLEEPCPVAVPGSDIVELRSDEDMDPDEDA